MAAIRASMRGAVQLNELPDDPLVATPRAVPPLEFQRSPGTTLEDLDRPLLEPMLKAWLDANLPEIVDRAAQAEIARLTGQDRTPPLGGDAG